MVTLEEVKEYAERKFNMVEGLSYKSREKNYIAGKALFFKLAKALFGAVKDREMEEASGYTRFTMYHYIAKEDVHIKEFPQIMVFYNQFMSAYKFLLDDRIIEGEPDTIHESLKYHMDINEKLKKELLFRMTVDSEEIIPSSMEEEAKPDRVLEILDGLDEDQMELVCDRLEPIVKMVKSARFYKLTDKE